MSSKEDDVSAWNRSSEDRFRLAAIVESSNDAIVAKDLDGIVTSWNNAAEALFGFPADDIIGQPIARIIPPDRVDEEALILDRVRRGERIVNLETERRCRNGKIIPVAITVSPIRDDHGTIIGVSKIARDLSEIHHMHRDLAHREALLSAILDTAPDALVVIDRDGIIQSFSTAAAALFCHRPQEAVGQNVNILMPSPDREEHGRHLERYLATGERHVIGVGRIAVGQRKDGSTFPMELTVGEVNLPGTQLFAGFMRDLTLRQAHERRVSELQAELVHVSRVAELGQLVSALAHEVNQPLTAMTSYLSGIRRLLAADNPQAVPQALERVAEQAVRAREIIRRIREHVTKRETEYRTESLSKTIEEAVTLAMVGVNPGVKLTTEVADGADAVVIDRIEIQQVLLNLIRNAVEAMAEAATREIRITAVPSGGRVDVGLADTGPGLPETVRARLFQPFVTTKSQGMGVGLSVCRTIVEAHGGELRAEDGSFGGTVFRFSLPRAEVLDRD